jgi:addiction module RelE/StbE family toxin
VKKYSVVYLKRAQQDLGDIFDYIYRDSPEGAARFLDEIDKKLGRLARFPTSGSIPKDERLRKLGYRVVVVGEYLAFYRIQKTTVQIRRVIHGRRRYAFLL